MQQRKSSEMEADPRVDLAVERTELALERTHLAWIRTMFTIITAGIAIDKGMAYIHDKRVLENKALLQSGHALGITLTSFGTVLLLIETFQFVRRNRQLAVLKNTKPSYFSSGAALSALVLVLGLVLIYLMIVTD